MTTTVWYKRASTWIVAAVVVLGVAIMAFVPKNAGCPTSTDPAPVESAVSAE